MKNRLLVSCLMLMQLPLLLHAQDVKTKEVKLACLTVNDTIKFQLPHGFTKGETFWFGEGFAESYVSESGSQVAIICGNNYRKPTLKGKQYVVTSQQGMKREGKIRKSDYIWREENFVGFTVYYTKVKECDKVLFDRIVDEIIAQVKKEYLSGNKV